MIQTQSLFLPRNFVFGSKIKSKSWFIQTQMNFQEESKHNSINISKLSNHKPRYKNFIMLVRQNTNATIVTQIHIFTSIIILWQGLSQRPIHLSFERAASKLDEWKILTLSLWTAFLQAFSALITSNTANISTYFIKMF